MSEFIQQDDPGEDPYGLTDEEYSDPVAAEEALESRAMEQMLQAWGEANPLPVSVPVPTLKHRVVWFSSRIAAGVAFLLIAGLGVVAYAEHQSRKRSELARDLHEAKSKAEILTRALLERARSRMREPRYGRVTDTRQLLVEAGESLRGIEDEEVVRELELQIRSAYAATLSMVDVQPGERTQLAANGLTFWPLAAHPGGKALAIATTGGPVVLKRGGKLERAAELRPLAGAQLHYSPDGTYLALLSPKGGLQLFDRDASRVLAVLEPEGKAVYLAIAFLPGGKSVRAFTAAGQVRTWELSSRKQTADQLLEVKGMKRLTTARFDAKGAVLLLGDAAGGIRLLPVDGKEGPKLPPMSGYVEAVAWAPDGGRFAVGCRDGSVLVFRASGTPVLTLRGLDMAETLNFSPDGRWLLGSQRNNNGRLWDTQTGEGLEVPNAPITVCDDGKTLASTSTAGVFFHELLAPTAIQRFGGHQGTPARLVWSAGGKGKGQFFATLDNGFHLRVWKVGQHRPLLEKVMPRSGMHASNASVALSKDGRHVAYASSGSISHAEVLEVATGKVVGEWSLPAGFDTLVADEDDRFLSLREEPVKRTPVLQTVVYDLTPGKPAKATRVLREATEGDKEMYFRSATTPSGLYWWMGPRQPADKPRVEVRQIATGAVVSKIPIRAECNVVCDGAGKTLWIDEGAGRIHSYDLTKPSPGVRQRRMPQFVSTNGTWAGYVPEPEPGATPALVLERSGKPYVALRGATAPVFNFSSFSPDESKASWGYSQDGVAVIADLAAMEAAVDGFMRSLRR